MGGPILGGMSIEASDEVLAGLQHWRTLEAAQQPAWPEPGEVEAVATDLRGRMPLVFAGEAESLRGLLAQAARGEAFVLQGGDCAETFATNTADNVRRKMQTLLQMSVVLTYAGGMPIVKMGRMAGQYAKPRSTDTETRDAVTLPSYRGDAVNGSEFTAQARRPDPARMLEMYHRAAATLNLMRAFSKGGYADLRRVQAWNRGFTRNPAFARYEDLAERIDSALNFMAAADVDFDAIKGVDVFAAHEALLLEYESALTRIDSLTGRPYLCSTHFPWIGERTRQLDGAHVDLLSRVRNPVGVKLGPATSRDEVLTLLERLDPEAEIGRLTFITRFGAQKVRDLLPTVLETVQEAGHTVTWVCDPMHGNTFTSSNGYKTRELDTIMDEVRGFFEAHAQVGTEPGGLHVELTGDDVTEVLGGTDVVDVDRLALRYETLVDPRLNHQQSLEVAFLVSELLTDRRRDRSQVAERV